MRSHSSSLNLHHHLCCLGFLQTQKRFSLLSGRTRILFDSRRFSRNGFKLNGSNVRRHGCGLRRSLVQVRAMDEDFAGIFLLDDWGDNEGTAGYMPPSSDGEDSDGEIILNPITDVDLPSINEQFVSSDDALRVTSHRFAMLGKGRKKHGSKSGVLINMGLITFLTTLILFVDWCAWKIVRLPLAPFHLTRPFFISAVLVSCAGYICVPLLRSLKIHQIFRKEGPIKHSFKKKTPTMGGLFFIPIGIIVAKVLVGFSSIEVSGAATATLAFAAVGLLDDILSLTKNHNNGLSAWIRILLEVAVGMCFSFWLDTTSISSPYDGLDGLAGGTAALAFIGMSIAVLPICSDLAVFGASMAGACVGFLLHNRYKASVFMGDTGSLALGGALAAMAACTGMFFPLFISSGIFVLEALSVIMQVSYFKTTKYLLGTGRRVFRMAPFHHHLELCGLKEPVIVASAYVISSMLVVFAGYVGLISA